MLLPSTRRGRSCLWKAPTCTFLRKWSNQGFVTRAVPPPPAWPSPLRPARSLGGPEPPSRRLGYPGEGPEGGVVPWRDSGSAGGPEGRGRRAPGEAWSQLSGEERVELTRPLRVESGRASPPGVDPSRRRLDRRDLRQEGPQANTDRSEPVAHTVPIRAEALERVPPVNLLPAAAALCSLPPLHN